MSRKNGTSTASYGFSGALAQTLAGKGFVFPQPLRERLLAAVQGERLPLNVLDSMWLEVERQALSDLGLELGSIFKPEHFDVLGLLMSSCASLADASALIVRYSPLIGQGGQFSLRVLGTGFQIIYTPQFNAARRIRVEAILAGVVQFTRWFAGEPIKPLMVQFAHEAGARLVDYHRVLVTTNVRFDQPVNAVTFTRTAWRKVHKASNPVLIQQLSIVVDQQMAKLQPADWLGQVTSIIQNQPWVTRAEVARQMGCSERHLNRLLTKHGHQFKALSDAVCKARCAELLQQGNISQARLAEYFGYSDVQAFAKAFKRWFGVNKKMYTV